MSPNLAHRHGYLLLAGLLAVAFLGLGHRAASADSRQRGGAVDAPVGSYAQTCRSVRADRARLDATCETRDGRWRQTTLEGWRSCRGDISNEDGRLSCGRGRGLQGSYVQTCGGVRVVRGTLLASCQRRDGSWRETRLRDAGSCRGDISNEDGSLTCAR